MFSLEDDDEEQSQLANELIINMGKGKILVEKRSFLNNTGLCLSAREKVVNNSRIKIYPIKNLDKVLTPNQTPEPTPDSTLKPTVCNTPKPTK